MGDKIENIKDDLEFRNEKDPELFGMSREDWDKAKGK